MIKQYSILLLFIFSLTVTASAATKYPDEPMRELRAVWLTSVWNIDWPHSTSVSAQAQQTRLINMLDVLRETNINAVLFQVRPNADALYRSAYEPWSQWITGTRGQEPAYDPLAFLIEEANKRGMEVHAWLNPYRYENTAGQYAGLPGDYSVTHPELIFTHNNRTYFDPGNPATTQLLKEIIADLITTYELDGVVFDDYFYPSGMPLSADQQTFDSFSTEELQDLILPYYPTITRGNFRRASVNRMIREVNDTIKAINPHMVFGVSPAGIYSTQAAAAANWGTTLPSGITGADNFNTIFCDPLAWLHDGSVDYLSPQLYWPIGGNQDYLTLVDWWGKECKRKGKHAYPSIASYRLPSGLKEPTFWDNLQEFFLRLFFKRKTGVDDFDKSGFTLQEIENQILANRNNTHNNVLGTIFFSTRDLTSRVPSLAPFLAEGVFEEKAIFPYIDWFTPIQTGAPVIAEIGSIGEDPKAAFIQITNSPARQFLLYGWEEMPSKRRKSSGEFLQVVFQDDFSLFYHESKNYYRVAEFLPDKAIGNWSEPKAFQYTAPVTIVSPDNETICDMFTFSWTEQSESDYHQLLIAKQQSPNLIEYVSPGISANHFDLPSGLIAGQEHYSARVKTVSDGFVSYSAPAMFFTGYPLSTTLNAPANGALNIPLQATFQWNTVSGALHYNLQIAKGTSFDTGEMLHDIEPVMTNIFNLSLEDSGTEHIARVRAVDACGYAYWSEANTFTTTVESVVIPNEKKVLQAYPNPASDFLNVTYSDHISERNIKIYNYKGQLVREINKTDPADADHINIAGLPEGLYMVNIRTADKTQFSLKILKK
ncbi:MAG: family 10 glycosylhydrolase [Bacteroidales bacterium]|nr:family 10 glycosylhydrolase [Bacteroidales bacterium]